MIDATYTLFVFRHAPYTSGVSREGLEALLAAAAYDTQPKVIFMGEGVYQLSMNHNTNEYKLKNHEKMLGALSLYGVEEIFIEETSATQSGMPFSTGDSPQITLLSPTQCRNLFNKAKHIVSF